MSNIPPYKKKKKFFQKPIDNPIYILIIVGVQEGGNKMENKLNEKQIAVVKFLTAHKGEAFTLAQIAEGANLDSLKAGTTNTLVKKGIITAHKDAHLEVCPCCGRKTKVSTYEIA